MKISVRIFAVCILVSLCLPLKHANAQQLSRTTDYYWVEMIAGTGTFGKTSLGTAINFQHDRFVFRIMADGQFSDDWFSKDGRSIWEIGLLAGLTNSEANRIRTSFSRSFSSGLMLTTRRECVENCGNVDPPSVWETKTVVGLPLQGRVGWQFSRYAGIGIAGMANINITEMFGSLNLYLQLGKVR